MADGLAIMPVKMSIICRILSLTRAQDFAIKITIFAEKLAHSTVSISIRLGKKDHFLDPISQYWVLYHPELHHGHKLCSQSTITLI